MTSQQHKLDFCQGQNPLSAKQEDNSSTFSNNMSLPVHRWFRYSAGFSAAWVRSVIEEEGESGRTRILDPFAGSATTIIEGERCGVEAIGLESHPFVSRIGQAKLLWNSDIKKFEQFALNMERLAANCLFEPMARPKLLEKCFPSDALLKLDCLLGAWLSLRDESPESCLAWLALMAILRECSPVGTAQWQYILPNRSKSKSLDPFKAFRAKVSLFASDMAVQQRLSHGPKGRLLQEDARYCASIPDGWADLVVTSPPYANNYDYADATRLEMSFTREINGWGDLQSTVRSHLIRSCTQHVAPISANTSDILGDPLLNPIRAELVDVCDKLEHERALHRGKKPYHAMIAAYFSDLAKVWLALRRVTAPNCRVCFVVGDSAPYGVHVPVERWLGLLAVSVGFKSFAFEKTRDRNVKWRNRKHRVPLHEGRLWVEG